MEEKKCRNCHQPMRLLKDLGTSRTWRCDSDECKNLSDLGHVDETELNFIDENPETYDAQVSRMVSQFRERKIVE
jgi:hypothetical protein